MNLAYKSKISKIVKFNFYDIIFIILLLFLGQTPTPLIRIRIDIFEIPDSDPHKNVCGSKTLVKLLHAEFAKLQNKIIPSIS